MSDENAMWTCFRYFLYCLQPSSFVAKGANTKNAYIKSADSAYTWGIGTDVSYIGGARGISAVKSLGICLQSS